MAEWYAGSPNAEAFATWGYTPSAQVQSWLGIPAPTTALLPTPDTQVVWMKNPATGATTQAAPSAIAFLESQGWQRVGTTPTPAPTPTPTPTPTAPPPPAAPGQNDLYYWLDRMSRAKTSQELDTIMQEALWTHQNGKIDATIFGQIQQGYQSVSASIAQRQPPTPTPAPTPTPTPTPTTGIAGLIGQVAPTTGIETIPGIIGGLAPTTVPTPTPTPTPKTAEQIAQDALVATLLGGAGAGAGAGAGGAPPTTPPAKGYRWEYDSPTMQWVQKPIATMPTGLWATYAEALQNAPTGYVPEQLTSGYWGLTAAPKAPTAYPQPGGEVPTDPYGRTATWDVDNAEWRYPPDWGKDPATMAAGWLSPYEQFQKEQALWGRGQAEEAAKVQQRNYLAQLAAQPISWLQHATAAGETPVVQPWMPPLMAKEYAGTVAGAPLPGWTTPPTLGQLPALTTPGPQYQARMGPTAQQQWLGYEQMRTGARPEETTWRQWMQAPPGGKAPQLTFAR